MATNFVLYQTCSPGAEVSQDPLDRFSQSLHHMVGIELQMITTFYFFRYLKGRCHGNQLNWKNWHFLWTNLLCRAAIRKWTAIRDNHNSDFQKLDGMNISTSCAILVTFHPETSEFLLPTGPYAVPK